MKKTIVYCAKDSLYLPDVKTQGAIGADLRTSEEITLQPGERKLVKTGLKMALPDGVGVHLYPRSSLAVKLGLMMANSVGLVDGDYRGEICFPIINTSKDAVTIAKDERIGQMSLICYVRVGLPLVNPEDLEVAIEDGEKFENFETYYPTERGTGGFGSTGRS